MSDQNRINGLEDTIKQTVENGITYLTIMVNGQPKKIKLGRVQIKSMDVNNETGLISNTPVLTRQVEDNNEVDSENESEDSDDDLNFDDIDLSDDDENDSQ